MSSVEIVFQPKLYKRESLAQKDKEVALATGHERLVSVVGGVQEVRDKIIEFQTIYAEQFNKSVTVVEKMQLVVVGSVLLMIVASVGLFLIGLFSDGVIPSWLAVIPLVLFLGVYGYTGKVGHKTQETNNAVIKENVTRIFESWKENHSIVISFKAANLKVARKRRRGKHGRSVRSEAADSDGRITFIVPVQA
jgi:hypothetical protein